MCPAPAGLAAREVAAGAQRQVLPFHGPHRAGAALAVPDPRLRQRPGASARAGTAPLNPAGGSRPGAVTPGPGRRRRDHALRVPRLCLRRAAAVAAQPGPAAFPHHAGRRRPLVCRARGQRRRACGGGYGSGSHAYDAAVARLREGEYIAVLPEAGVSRSFTVRECKTGAVRMAAEAGVPIIPGLDLGRPPADDTAPWLLAAARPGVPRSGSTSAGRSFGLLPGPAEDVPAATAGCAGRSRTASIPASRTSPCAPAPGAWWMPAELGGGAPRRNSGGSSTRPRARGGRAGRGR